MPGSILLPAAFCQYEINLAILDIDGRNTNFQRIPKPVGDATAIACQPVADRIEVKIVTIECRDMHEAVDVDVVQHNEQAKGGHARDDARVLLAGARIDAGAVDPRVAPAGDDLAAQIFKADSPAAVVDLSRAG